MSRCDTCGYSQYLVIASSQSFQKMGIPVMSIKTWMFLATGLSILSVGASACESDQSQTSTVSIPTPPPPSPSSTPTISPTPPFSGLVVTNTDNSGTGSLRAAIEAAAANGPDVDVINFAVTGTIVLTETLVVDSSVEIRGPGAEQLILSGLSPSGSVQIMEIPSSTAPTVILEGLTLTGGTSDVGGGAITNFGTLTIRNSILRNNGTFGDGGAIRNENFVLTIEDSTLASNTAVNAGGAIISGPAAVVLRNNRFVQNVGQQTGGAVAIFNSEDPSVVSTLTDNVFEGNLSPDGPTAKNVFNGSGAALNATGNTPASCNNLPAQTGC